MTLNQHNELVALRAANADLKARLKKWKDSHHKWEQYAHSLERQLQTNACNASPDYQWDPAPFSPGWRSNGDHNLAEFNEHRASLQRQAEELRHYTLAANTATQDAQYTWDPAPGDEGWQWKRDAKEAA
jgi:hypothetical protein